MGDVNWISSTGNWNDTSSWSTGVVPVAGDDVTFDGTSNVDVANGLDQSAVNLGSVTVDPAYTGNIGQPGNPIKLKTAKLLHRGTGTLTQWIFHSGGGSNDTIVVDSDNMTNAYRLVDLSNSSAVSIVCRKGGIIENSAVTIPNIDEIYVMPRSGALVNIETHTTIINVFMSGGVWQAKSGAATTVIHTGGHVIASGITAATYYLVGGDCDWTNSGSIPVTVHAMAGRFDFSGVVQSRTITEVNLWPGVEWILSGKVSITTLRDFREPMKIWQ